MSEWISVKDQLPTGGEMVLLYITEPFDWGKPYIRIGYHKCADVSGDKMCWGITDIDDVVEDGLVSHWMPMPEPPKEN